MEAGDSTKSPSPADIGDGEDAITSCDIPRHVDFLRCYLGRPTDDFRSLKWYMTIGVRIVADRRAVEVTQAFGRHSVLSVEGDRAYATLVRVSNEVASSTVGRVAKEEVLGDASSPVSPLSPAPDPLQPRAPHVLPNAVMCCLHYGNNTVAFPHTTFRVILSSTTLQEGDAIFVCPRSVRRCQDELGWYQAHSGNVKYTRHHRAVQQEQSPGTFPDAPLLPEPRGILGTRRVPLWPAGVPYYHGVGARHASEEALVSFPSTLLELQRCPQLGPDELEVVAGHRIAYGTCFLYAGPTHLSKSAAKRTRRGAELWQPPTSAIAAEESYHIFLSKGVTCHGQCIARYINHRFNFSRTGNVDLAAAMIPVQRDKQGEGNHKVAGGQGRGNGAAKKQGGDRRVTLDNNNAFVSIPFFVISNPVEVGCRVLARSYGNEYDARLERQAMTSMQWVPYCCAAVCRLDGQPLSGCSRTFDGTYLQSVDVGSLVWRPNASAAAERHSLPWLDVYVVVQRLHASVVVLRAVGLCSTTEPSSNDYVVLDVPHGAANANVALWCCNVEEVALLIEDVDFVDAAAVLPRAGGCGGRDHRVAMVKSWVHAATHVVYSAVVQEPYLFGAMWPYRPTDV